jgi:uncharacterized protein (TIGR03435 family)
MRAFAYISLTVLLSGAAFGQTAVTAPAFVVADIHVSPHSNNPTVSGGFIRNGRYELRSATMVDLIGRAYGIDGSYVTGGPGWIDTDRFDVIANVAPGSTPEMLKAMLQTLLADRFQLAIHKDSKSVQAWILTAGKHPSIRRSDGSGDGGCERERAESSIINGVMSCQNATLAQFVEMLQIPNAQVTSYLGNYAVKDSTELKGSWDFTMRWTGRGALANAGGDGVTLFDAIEKQLGLKLELQATPLPVVVVDSVNRQPTDNLPGVTQKLPELPTEFEVADIKLSTLDKPARAQFQAGGRFSVRGITLMGLVRHAWNADSYDGMIVGAPKWMDSERFDIVAKVAMPDGVSGVLKDDDTFKAMLRQLLRDRFRMAIRTEEQPVTVYALVAASPKLKKADPSNRTGCKYTGAAGSGQVSAMLSTYNCQNMSTLQLVVGCRGSGRRRRGSIIR